MYKIYISPSDQIENRYAVAGTNEANECHRIGRALESALSRIPGIEAKYNSVYSISQAIAESNAWGADVHICIHTNAFDGIVTGTRLFYGDPDGLGYKCCVGVMRWLAPITPGNSDNITQVHNLNEIANVKAYTCYVEVGFHDNETEARWIIEHTTDIAESIAHGICDGLDLEWVPSFDALVEDTVGATLYKVQVGAFARKENAEKLLANLRIDYPDAFIMEVPK